MTKENKERIGFTKDQMEVALNVRQEFPVEIVDLAFVKNLKKTRKH